MRSFTLIRRKWSNEHVMAVLFIVLLLYLLPRWIEKPADIIGFLVLLAAGLLMDVLANFIRYRRPICAVSAAVTTAVLDILTPDIPLAGKLLGIAFGLIIGKHIWGGTGKNIFNPAASGLLLLSLVFDIELKIFFPTTLLLPAIALSAPFIRFRPFAALGLYSGMVLALIYRQESSIANIISYGTFFWGFILATDPVTVTPHPYIGLALGVFFGFIPLSFSNSLFFMALGLLILNTASYVIENLSTIHYSNNTRFKPKKAVPFIKNKILMHDITEHNNTNAEDSFNIDKDEIMSRIRDNNVFGFGGAAFPTYEKIKAVLESNVKDKYLIINGVECDPGLIHDKWLMLEYPNEIYKGVEMLIKCIDFKSITLAVKDSKGLKFPESLKTYVVGDYYPAGAERYLINEVLHKKLPYGAVPAREGILILNVQTIYHIYEAAVKNIKAETRFLTLANIREGTGMVVKSPLGSRVMDIVKKIYPKSNIAFCGGGIMKCHTASEDEAIGKTINFIGISDFPRYKESPLCSKCGSCSSSCPEGLMVNKIAEIVDANKMDKVYRYNAERCLDCGICSSICPAGRNLSARVQAAREYMLNNKN